MQGKGENRLYRNKLHEKLNESLRAVLPIVGIVLFLSFTVAPMPPSILMAFLIGSVFLIIGMMFFSLGAELSMAPMGERLGARITRTKKLAFILPLGFLLGFMVTISEPDLQVLANQVKDIPSAVLIITVAAGVGLFLVVALLRMFFSIALPRMLTVFYLLVFLLAAFAPKSILAVAFDAGGVTTGPMTVPFIMAFGIGISAIRSDSHAADDSFGLVALSSIGPVLATLLLGLIYRPSGADYTPTAIPTIESSVALGRIFIIELPAYLSEMALALLPILLFFTVFQIVSLKLNKHLLMRIAVGAFYTYIGLVLFLTGANVGFMPAGSYLGEVLASLSFRNIIIPFGMLIGYFIVRAEPAVYVLMDQVEEITDGAIPGNLLKRSLSISVAASVGLAMIRVLTGLPIFCFLIPGYFLAIALSYFVPKIFTAIAFDAGGVASGPMTAAFLLPFAMGACSAVGGNIVTDAFGVVAMVAMTPLFTLQILGFVYRIKARRAEAMRQATAFSLSNVADDEIIEL